MNAPAPKLSPISRGVHQMTMEQYLSDPCPAPSLSSSIAKVIVTESPRHAWFQHPRLNPDYVERERTDFDIGTCAHAILLEGDESKLAPIDPQDHTGPRGGVPKGWTNDSIKAARDNARQAGLIPLLTKDMDRVRAMVDVARAYIKGSEIEEVIATGEPELTLIWDEGPIWCKARPDFTSKDRRTLIHYKTTARSAQPDSFSRFQFSGMGYDVTAMFYERAMAALFPDNKGDFNSVFLIQESAAPFECSLLGLDPELRMLAAAKVERAFGLWERCMKSGNWPAYPKRVQYIQAKPWEVAEFEAKAFTDDELDGGIPL